jgi:hypothetical protein
MNKQLKKAVKKYGKMCDVFTNPKHEERKAIRLQWKDKDLDADPKPIGVKALQAEVKKYADLSSPFKLKNDRATPSYYANDKPIPRFEKNN